MKFSMLPVLFLIQIVVMFRVFHKVEASGGITSVQRKKLNFILLAIVFWAAISSYLGINGYYANEKFLSSLPGLWITQIPVFIVISPWLLSKNIRSAINTIIDKTPLYKKMLFEGLRILAIGGIIKGFMGEFSLFFTQTVAIPDFIYAAVTLSAAYLIYRGVWQDRSAIITNLLGFLILVPGAMILMNFSLPGPMNLIQESPSLQSIFEFPMSMAPTVVVPIFAMVNLFVVVRLIQRRLR